MQVPERKTYRIVKRRNYKSYSGWEEIMLKKDLFIVGAGFMGYVEGEYILFASETDYYEFMEDAA